MIGAVMVPGAKAPKPITRKMFRLILRDSVFVETTRVATHDNPTYKETRVLYYCMRPSLHHS